MAIEEKEEQTTSLKDLIELVEKDPIPTNIFTIEDKDPMVILGKLNEVIAYLKNLQATINSSDTKANQALESALKALSSASESLQASTTALNSANKALETANLAIDTANTSLGVASDAKSSSSEALRLSNLANENADSAKETADSAKERAETANVLSANALDTAGEANTKADNAIESADSALSTANEAKTKADNASATSNEAITKADNASTTSNEAITKANNALQIAQDALNQVIGSLGSKVYDNHGNIMSNVKFAGHNGINVDMAEDNETFDIRLDEDITKAIEDTHKQAQANAEDIVNITDMLAGVEEKVETELPNRITAVENSITDMAPDVARALKVPMSTPAQLKLIGVNTSNDQEMLNVGNGLEKVNDNLQVSETLRAQVQSNTNQISSLAGNLSNKANQVALDTTNQNVSNLDANKANKDLSNVTYPHIIANGVPQTGTGDRVIETYISSDRKTWYRKWKSGWRECGFNLQGDGLGWAKRTLTFPNIIFTSINSFNVQCSMDGQESGNTVNVNSVAILNKTTSSIQVYCDSNWKRDVYICGY